MTTVFFSVGNPQNARHSAGHRVLEHLVAVYATSELARAPRSQFSATSDGANVFFVRSETYMNESDRGLSQFLRQNRTRPGDTTLVVLHDDFERPLGQVVLAEVKKKESHNGLKSLSKVFLEYATMAVKAMHIGIGPKPQGASSATMAKWVLAPFGWEEEKLFGQTTMERAEEVAREVVLG